MNLALVERKADMPESITTYTAGNELQAVHSFLKRSSQTKSARD